MKCPAPIQSRRAFLQGSLALAGMGILSGCGALTSWTRPAPRVPRIGVMLAGGPATASLREGLRQGFRDLGYVPGETIILEERGQEGGVDQYPAFAAELVSMPVDILVVSGTPGIFAAKAATSTIPIVIASGSPDPIKAGLIASYAHPGGNITGLNTVTPQLSAKRIEVLKEAMPVLSKVAILWSSSDDSGDQLEWTRGAAQRLGLETFPVEANNYAAFEGAFMAATQGQAQGAVILSGPVTVSGQSLLGQLAARYRLPAVSNQRSFVEAGGLITYGPGGEASLRRAATFVDKILKGAKPADLPMEEPTVFEYLVNLKSAQALGLTIPQSVLQQATEIIQ